MLNTIDKLSKEFLQLTEILPIRIISHHDTDGITSASILIQALKRLNKKFSVKIIKGLEESIIKDELKRNEILFFCDLASSSLNYLKEAKNPVFILDHHEINKEDIPENIHIVNSLLFNEEDVSGAGLCYLFAKALSPKNKDLAKLALIGMIGDRIEHISKTAQSGFIGCLIKIRLFHVITITWKLLIVNRD